MGLNEKKKYIKNKTGGSQCSIYDVTEFLPMTVLVFTAAAAADWWCLVSRADDLLQMLSFPMMLL